MDEYLAEVRNLIEARRNSVRIALREQIATELLNNHIPNLLAIIEAQREVVEAARECLHASDNNTGHEPSYSVWLRAEDEERKALADHDARVKEVLDGK